MSVLDASLLSVGEAAMNIVQHGFDGGATEGRIKLEIVSEENELVFRLYDNAASFVGKKFHTRNLDEIRPGGLGLYFMHELMDSVKFMSIPADQGNMLEMRKRIKPE